VEEEGNDGGVAEFREECYGGARSFKRWDQSALGESDSNDSGSLGAIEQRTASHERALAP
jgi:hypothetical protein